MRWKCKMVVNLTTSSSSHLNNINLLGVKYSLAGP
ncbi:MAG: hypothetical protein AB8I56_20435 [Anaerolineales bacterium]